MVSEHQAFNLTCVSSNLTGSTKFKGNNMSIDPYSIPEFPREHYVPMDPSLLTLTQHVPYDPTTIKDQRPESTCVPHAMTAVLRQMGMGDDYSIKFHYGASLTAYDRLNETGIRLFRAFNVLHHFGVCTEQEMPSTWGPYNVTPNATQYELAQQNKIYQWQCITGSSRPNMSLIEKRDAIRSALQEGFHVIIGVKVTEQFYGLTGHWKEQNYQKSNPAFNPALEDHCMYITEYEDGFFRCVNSYGTNWGDNGTFGIRDTVLCTEPSFEAWIVRDFNGHTIAAEQPGIYLEELKKFDFDIRIVPEVQYLNVPVNMWIVAELDNSIYYQSPTGTVATGMTLAEVMANPNVLQPFQTGLVLDNSNYMELIQGQDLRPFEGATIYIAYGNTLADAVIENFTIPENL